LITLKIDIMMKRNRQAMATAYEAPKVEVIEVQVEQGFATSNIVGGTAENEGMQGGGDIGVTW